MIYAVEALNFIQFLDKKGALYNVVNIFGERLQWLMYGVTQALYALFCFLPTILLFKYYLAHFLFLCTVLLICIHNGASFYFQVFARKYKKNLRELYVVFPDFWVKMCLMFLSPFVSKKLKTKTVHVERVAQLFTHFSPDQLSLPEHIFRADDEIQREK